jgi:hypothetical protein
MSESNPTKDELADQLAAAQAENASLRAQLAAPGTTRPYQAPYTFQLSEGDRQELEAHGAVNIGGRMMTKDDVVKAMAAAGQKGVEIADAPEATRIDASALPGRGPGIAGIDFVYPSVERGKIDPKVAGTPGINGPAADAPTTTPAAE